MTEDGDAVVGSDAWRAWRRAIDLDDYEERFDSMAAGGGNPHGEADFVMRFAPRSVLDAGCGFGRVAAELAARGVDIVGVDLDPDMIERARRRSPALEWHVADLSAFDLDRTFDVVVLAGNVLGFAEPADRAAAFGACAAHVATGGRLVLGASLRRDWPSVDEQRAWAAAAGLVDESVSASWDGAPFADGDYAVLVFHRPG